jgi:hypothetical protein
MVSVPKAENTNVIKVAHVCISFFFFFSVCVCALLGTCGIFYDDDELNKECQFNGGTFF